MGDQRHAPCALPLGRALVPTGGGWVGPRTALDGFWRRDNPLLPRWGTLYRLRYSGPVVVVVVVVVGGGGQVPEIRPEVCLSVEWV